MDSIGCAIRAANADIESATNETNETIDDITRKN